MSKDKVKVENEAPKTEKKTDSEEKKGPKITEKKWKKDLEEPIYEAWKADKRYEYKHKKGKKVFSIDTPPPYVNSPIHIGHATTYSLMDMFARYHRMIGDNVLFPLGLDRNGLPIEMAAEKRFNIKLTETPRAEFVDKCEKMLSEASDHSIQSFLRLGISFNSWEEGDNVGDMYMTDSERYRTLTQNTFIDMWKKGLIYEDDRINNYCPGCRTTLADSEIDYVDAPSSFNDIIFKVKETGEEIIIGTTRPELVCTCAMVIFNPDDERYSHLEGKTAITPLFEKEVPIKSHPQADMEKGTGLVMMCSAGDLADIRFFIEQGLKPVIAIGQDGKMNEHAGFLKGLKVKEARAKMIEDLKEKELLIKQVKTTHRTPCCERCKSHIEFISMPELYVKQVEYKDHMQKIGEELNFYDKASAQIYKDWVDSIAIDWAVSRRRFYATEIPLWYCEECDYVHVPEKGKYYKPWKESCPIDKCPECGSKNFRGEERVFDTWFDSSNSPLYILKYYDDPKFFKEAFPCTLRPQGKEIIRTWLYYTLIKNYHLNGTTVFNDAWINYHIVDAKGYKMSKSKGNGIDPQEVLDKYGAEAFRLWSTLEGNLEKGDFKCSFDRIEAKQKILTKLWNVTRFISMFDMPKKEVPVDKLRPIDHWIIKELNRIVEFANERFAIYDFHRPMVELRHFLWETFASHYLELVKSRAYNNEGHYEEDEKESACYTLYYCLKTMLKVFAPVIPFITAKIYNDIYEKDIHAEKFPVAKDIGAFEEMFTKDELYDLNGEIWKTKKDNKLSLRDPINTLVVPAKFEKIGKELKVAHNVTHLEFGDELTFKEL